MANKYISDILLQYDRDRSMAEDAALERQAKIYIKIPRLKEIDMELSLMGIEIARAAFNKDIDINAFIESKKQKSIDLKIERAELLTHNNLPIDYMEPSYKCKDCHDTGYIGVKKCHCFKQMLIDRYYSQSNLKHILDKENFDSFIFEYYSVHKFEDEVLSPRKNIEEIFTACVNFVNNFDRSGENLFFYGKSGLGKTFLSNCIARDILDRGKLVIYQTSSSLIDLLKDVRFDDSNDMSRDKVDDVFDCDLLIIDDLGTEYISDYSQTVLFNVINKRLLSNKKLIISTNLSLENLLKTYAERITSRVFGNFTMYKFYGDDIRLKIGQQNRKKRK
jgi:DNA replication protein